ncbi:adenosine kinase [Sphingomonas flavescens]|uniref:adenosine kinase n=1 Tax=Sphingomonas flavescens TaxID=3132797 RepID=UPI00280573CE|nr:adenosine kinase [Sphingomonas limnosediminicola]
MTSDSLDIVAIGDAIVDVIATTDDAFIERHGLPRGGMQLLDAEQADALYAAMGPAREISGGSAANSMAGAAALGLNAAFVGQVADDQLGAIFAHDMRSLGVWFETPAIASPPPTGRCLILVTPDAQRTMNTCPGASHELTPAALDAELIRSASVTFLEGYLWGPERPRAAMLEAAKIAHSAGRTVAFTLSESLCLGNRRSGVMSMIDAGTIDLLFGNEDEVRHLTGCGTLGECLAQLSTKVATLVITRGADGAIARSANETVEVSAPRVQRVVDTTGAGDLFAAGFLAARCRGRPLKACLETGGIAAAEVISHFGARPEANIKELAGL